MEQTEIKQTLIDVIAGESGLPKEMDCDANFMQLGIQSITLMKIQMEIAKRFSVKLKFREFIQNNSVNQLAGHLKDRLGVKEESHGE